MGSPKWHALPEFREHVFECEEPSCVRDVRDSAPLLRLGPLPPERCETRRWPQQGQLARRAWAIHHMDRCARSRVGICMQELTTTGSLARLHVFQPHNNVYYAPRPVCV